MIVSFLLKKQVSVLNKLKQGKSVPARLGEVIKQLSNTLLNGEHWILQQDFAPAHKAKISQQ